MGREVGGRVLLREGDGEVVHQHDGVAAGRWGEAKSLEEEGSGEEMLIFGFVVVAQRFSEMSVNSDDLPLQPHAKRTPTFQSSPNLLVTHPLPFPLLHPFVFPPSLLLQQCRDGPHQLLLRGILLINILVRIMLPQFHTDSDRLPQNPRPLPLVPFFSAQLLHPRQAIFPNELEYLNRLSVLVQFLVKSSHLDLHTEHLVAERVETHLIGQFDRLSVVLESILGLDVDVCVEERAAQLCGDGLRVGFEVSDYVDLVDVVCVEEHADAKGYSGRVVREGRAI